MRFLSNTFDRFRQHGVVGTLRKAIDRAAFGFDEWRLGVNTSGSIPAAQLGHGEKQYGYQPVDPRSLKLALDWLPLRPTDVFVDMGCGLGRALVVAARYPFARVMGVEFSKELFVGAMRNCRRASARLGKNCQVIHADATRWEFPDDATVVFMFNPFQGEKLQAMLNNLRDSIERAPRIVHVVYSLPKFDRDLLADCQWLENAHDVDTPNPEWERLTIYRSIDANHRLQ